MYENTNLDGSTTAGDRQRQEPTKITICYFLIASYASSIGGCGTLIGSATNMTLKNMYMDLFPDAPDLDFPSFMAYAAPVVLVQTLLVWVWMQFLYMGMFRPASADAKAAEMGKEGEAITLSVVCKKYSELGPMRSNEKSVAILFVLALTLWFFRKPGFVTGWAELLTDLKVGDSTASLFIIVLMFIVPARWSWLDWFTKNEGLYAVIL